MRPADAAAFRAAQRYVGPPYRDPTPTDPGFHCWTLVADVHRQEAAIELPLFDTTPHVSRPAVAHEIGRNVPWWVEVPAGAERWHDVALFSLFGAVVHVGIVVAPGWVLHVDRGRASRVQRVADPGFGYRPAGFRRHPSLA